MECSICSTEVDPEFMNLCACCGEKPHHQGTHGSMTGPNSQPKG